MCKSCNRRAFFAPIQAVLVQFTYVLGNNCTSSVLSLLKRYRKLHSWKKVWIQYVPGP